MTRVEQTIKVIRDVLLYVLLFAAAISYHPTIMRMSRAAGYENGTILSRYIILLFGAVFLLSISLQAIKHSKMIRFTLIWLAVITVFALFVQAFFRNSIMMRELRTFFIVLGSMMIGYDLRADGKKYSVIILAFCLTTLFSGLMQVLVNNGGFQIANQYLADSKNSIGAMLATVGFSFFYLYRSSDKHLMRIAYLGLALLTVVVMITIRARMAFVALVLVGLFYYYLIKRARGILITVIALGAVGFLVILIMPGFVLDYLEASFTAGTQGEDFTSGRLYTYGQALSFLMESPLLGNIQKINQIGWVHNYLLLKLYDFGLLFCWPIYVLYFGILIKTIKCSMRSSSGSRECFGYVCLLLPFVISMAEPTFPFGPGTVNMFNYILLGISERELYMRLKAASSPVQAIDYLRS